MKPLVAFLLLLSAPIFAGSPGPQKIPAVPWRIHTCFEPPKLGSYKIDTRINPYYLRGDFDGDGKPDFAVMIVGPNSKSTGLAVCQGDGRSFVLGAGTTPKFSTKEDDNFLSSDWEVLTPVEFREYLYDKKAGALAKGEVISLNWEDGNAYIYWDGKRYCWFEEPVGGPEVK